MTEALNIENLIWKIRTFRRKGGIIMGMPIILYGKSGAGKTYSFRNLKGAAIISVIKKPLSFRNSNNILTCYCPEKDDVINAITTCPAKTIIIDDAGYLMTKLFMGRKRGGNQFEVYNEIGSIMWDLMNFIIDDLPDTKTVYLVFHEEQNDMGEASLLTIGKLLDQKVNLAGMVTVTIHAIIKAKKHVFRTNSDGSDVSKSPHGMFEKEEVENDLAIIDKSIRDFYGI